MRYHQEIQISCACVSMTLFFKFAHQLALLGEVSLAQHPVVDLDKRLVLVITVIGGEDRTRQIRLNVDQRVRHAAAIGLQHDREIAAAHRVGPRSGGHHPLRHLQADLAPFVDEPSPDVFIGLIDVAVQQFETETLGPGLLQQAPGFRPRFLDVGPETGELLQLLLCRGER